MPSAAGSIYLSGAARPGVPAVRAWKVPVPAPTPPAHETSGTAKPHTSNRAPNSSRRHVAGFPHVAWSLVITASQAYKAFCLLFWVVRSDVPNSWTQVRPSGNCPLRRIRSNRRSYIIGIQPLANGIADHDSQLERAFVTLAHSLPPSLSTTASLVMHPSRDVEQHLRIETEECDGLAAQMRVHRCDIGAHLARN